MPLWVLAFGLEAHDTKTRRKVQECSFSDSMPFPNPPVRKSTSSGKTEEKGGEGSEGDKTGEETEKSL